MRDYLKTSHNLFKQNTNKEKEYYQFKQAEFLDINAEKQNNKDYKKQLKKNTSKREKSVERNKQIQQRSQENPNNTIEGFDFMNLFKVNSQNKDLFLESKQKDKKVDQKLLNQMIPQKRCNIELQEEQNKQDKKIIKINTNLEQDVEFYVCKEKIKEAENQTQQLQREPEPKIKDIKPRKGYKTFKGMSQNMTRLNMKGKYQESTKGNLYLYKTRYTANGKLKETKNSEKYKKLQKLRDEKKVNLADNSNNLSVMCNILENDLYMQSLSAAFKVQLVCDGDNAQQHEKQLDMIQEQLKKEIKDKSIQEILQKQFLIRILNTFFKFEAFINQQEATIISILSGENVLTNSFTGSGKSLIFQFISLIQSIRECSLGVVLCPTISLCLNHVQNLPPCIRGAAYTSAIKFNQKLIIKNYIKQKELDILFICPELMEIEIPDIFSIIPLSFICIDEAHQIIENYRISYQKLPKTINQIQQQNKLKTFSIILLTATADSYIRNQLKIKLNIHQNFIGQLFRPNQIVTVSRDTEKLSSLLKIMDTCERNVKMQRIILFCGSIYAANRVNWFLQNNFFDSNVYHSFIEKEEQIYIINKFQDENVKYSFHKTKVIVTTQILSMGIDIKNINGIIFLGGIKHFEGFIQALGRGARVVSQQFDIMQEKQQSFVQNKFKYQGFSHIFLNKNDYFREKNQIVFDYYNYELAIKKIFELINTKSEKIFNIEEIAKDMNLRKEQVFHLLNHLEMNKTIDSFKIIQKVASIKFYKIQAQQMAKENILIDHLIKYSKKNGAVYKLDIIKAQKSLKQEYNEILSQLQNLQKQRLISIEMSEEIVQIIMTNKITIDNYDDIYNKVVKFLKEQKERDIFKLDCVYLTLTKLSFPSVEYLQKNNYQFSSMIIKEEENNKISLYTQQLGAAIDAYFKQETGDLSAIINDQVLLESGRPRYQFEQESDNFKQYLYQSIQAQLDEELNQFGGTDKMQIVYKNPVYLTSVLFGIFSPLIQWKDWKYNNLWEKYSQFDFEELYQIVNQIVCDYVLQNKNIGFQKQKVK